MAEKRIAHIEKQEKTLDEFTQVLKDLKRITEKWENLYPDFSDLMAYYSSEQWLKDMEAHNKGELKNIKCGVLSQDAVYNLYDDQKQLTLAIMQTALKYLEK